MASPSNQLPQQGASSPENVDRAGKAEGKVGGVGRIEEEEAPECDQAQEYQYYVQGQCFLFQFWRVWDGLHWRQLLGGE